MQLKGSGMFFSMNMENVFSIRITHRPAAEMKG